MIAYICIYLYRLYKFISGFCKYCGLMYKMSLRREGIATHPIEQLADSRITEKDNEINITKIAKLLHTHSLIHPLAYSIAALCTQE